MASHRYTMQQTAGTSTRFNWYVFRVLLTVLIGEQIAQVSGCDLNVKDEDSSTALHYCALCGHNDAAELLLRLGADPSIVDLENKTAAQVRRAYGPS